MKHRTIRSPVSPSKFAGTALDGTPRVAYSAGPRPGSRPALPAAVVEAGASHFARAVRLMVQAGGLLLPVQLEETAPAAVPSAAVGGTTVRR